jgi:hypothetical protein
MWALSYLADEKEERIFYGTLSLNIKLGHMNTVR